MTGAQAPPIAATDSGSHKIGPTGTNYPENLSVNPEPTATVQALANGDWFSPKSNGKMHQVLVM